MFNIIPAIDLIDGQCVRLIRGDKTQKTVYSDNPEKIAKQFEDDGAKRIHLVDLDGAFEGKPKNFYVIKSIRDNTSAVLELGGGIRDIPSIEKYLNIGVNKVIIGSKAVETPNFMKYIFREFGDKIIIGVDAKDGKVAVHGWGNISALDAVDFTKKVEEMGGKEVIFTDIKTDGMLTGPNIEALKHISVSTAMKVIASGGVSSIDDIIAIAELQLPNVTEVIVGKSIYEEKVNLKAAFDELKKRNL